MMAKSVTKKEVCEAVTNASGALSYCLALVSGKRACFLRKKWLKAHRAIHLAEDAITMEIGRENMEGGKYDG